MARGPRFITYTVFTHGILWWLIIGWWWRPILFIFWTVIAALTGKGLKKRRINLTGKGF